MGHVEQFCEDICILKRGRMIVSGSLSDIKRSYGHCNLVLRSDEDIIAHLEGVRVHTIKANANE